MSNLLLASLLCITMATVARAAVACNDPDCIIYDISTQSNCVEVLSAPPTNNCKWFAGLGAFIDQKVKGGRIVAYKIRWFNGSWSGWYVPGVNDIDWKFNVNAVNCQVPSASKGLRRVWSYFYDHTHRYIICKAP